MRGILILERGQGEGGEKSLTQADRKPSPRRTFMGNENYPLGV